MATDTDQREREISQVAEASSRLGEIEGQVKLLVRRTEENARNARDDYRALDAKIDRTAKDLTDKIHGANKGLNRNVGETAADIRAATRADVQAICAYLRIIRYCVIGFGSLMIACVVILIVALLAS